MPVKTAEQTAKKQRHSPMEHPRLQYPEETRALQEIAHGWGLEETIKWGKPCFMFEGRNVALIQRFNEYVALMFFQGALLNDPEGLLFRIGEQMEAPRQLRFRSVAEVTRMAPTIRRLLGDAVALERSGAKVPRRAVAEVTMPEELRSRLEGDAALKKAFEALTPGRQKGYLFQIAGAKQSATRAARVEKFAPRILQGKGLND